MITSDRYNARTPHGVVTTVSAAAVMQPAPPAQGITKFVKLVNLSCTPQNARYQLHIADSGRLLILC